MSLQCFFIVKLVIIVSRFNAHLNVKDLNINQFLKNYFEKETYFIMYK